jgi:uncharacterized phage protein (TIGR02220 family)
MLSKKSKDIISKNEKLVNANIEKWVREAKAEIKIKIDWPNLIGYFNKVTGMQKRVIPEKAKRQFRARMKEGYTKEDIASVMKNGFESDHHKESLHKWFTIELCSRSKSFELYLTVKTNQDPHMSNPYKK